jgi:glycosyltransferase involved in cell wall biosynthesis
VLQLSIIIPVYNAAAFIDKCFSALTQHALPGTEVIFVNDGSVDESLQLLNAFAANHSYIKVLTKPNGGAASARNFGIKQASGAYITFVDADDTIDFKELFQLLASSAEHKLDICAYGYNYITNGGAVIKNSLRHSITYNVIDTGLSFLIQGYQPSSICVFLLDRNFIMDNRLFFVEGITHEDVEISLRYFLVAQKVYFSEKVIYNYYQNEGSVTNQASQQKKERYLFDEVEVAFLMKQNLAKYIKAEERTVIKKNYNSVTWNLLYQMLREKSVYGKQFRRKIIDLLQEKQLYPIKGPLKTKFQNLSRIFMNMKFIVTR